MNLQARKNLIKETTEKLGYAVEQIDLRSGWVRIVRNGQKIVVHFWRGISPEDIVSQINSYVRNV